MNEDPPTSPRPWPPGLPFEAWPRQHLLESARSRIGMSGGTIAQRFYKFQWPRRCSTENAVPVRAGWLVPRPPGRPRGAAPCGHRPPPVEAPRCFQPRFRTLFTALSRRIRWPGGTLLKPYAPVCPGRRPKLPSPPSGGYHSRGVASLEVCGNAGRFLEGPFDECGGERMLPTEHRLNTGVSRDGVPRAASKTVQAPKPGIPSQLPRIAASWTCTMVGAGASVKKVRERSMEPWPGWGRAP